MYNSQPGIIQQEQQLQPLIQHQPGSPVMTSTVTPAGAQWIPMPIGLSGLEHLATIDHLFVKQARNGFCLENTFAMYNRLGQQMYYASEESGCCDRHCCTNNREFIMHVIDSTHREVIRVLRPPKCCVRWDCACTCCAAAGSCCSSTVMIQSPPGVLVGLVQQRPSCCAPSFLVLDISRKPVLKIEGPGCCEFNCGRGASFLVKTMDAQTVGSIKKEWAGQLQECFSNADNFSINFPVDLALETKASLIGATFLIDYMAYEGCRTH